MQRTLFQGSVVVNQISGLDPTEATNNRDSPESCPIYQCPQSINNIQVSKGNSFRFSGSIASNIRSGSHRGYKHHSIMYSNQFSGANTYLVTSDVIHLFRQMQFLRLEFTLHIYFVARSAKPPASFVGRNPLLTECE